MSRMAKNQNRIIGPILAIWRWMFEYFYRIYRNLYNVMENLFMNADLAFVAKIKLVAMIII